MVNKAENKKVYRVIILDDSKCRKFNGVNTTYIYELKKSLNTIGSVNFNITVFGEEYHTTIEALAKSRELTQQSVDLLVVNLGINDCSPRILNRYLRNLLMKLPKLLAWYIRVYLLRKLRQFWFFLFGSRILVAPDEYRQNVLSIIKNINARKVVLVTICQTTDELEKKLPGLSLNIVKFNRILSEIAALKNAQLLDLYSVFCKGSVSEFLVDGVHYREKMCSHLGDELYKIILHDLQAQKSSGSGTS